MVGAGFSSDMHITVGAASIIGDEIPVGRRLSILRLEQELMLVKAALLYGDRATFYSPFASLVLRMVRLSDEPLREQLRYLEAAAERFEADGEPVAIPSTDVRRYREILRKSHPNNKQLAFKDNFERKVRLFQEEARRLADDAMGDGIVEAMDKGLLDVPRFGPTLERAMSDVDTSVDEFLAIMRATVSDPTTYPLFDAELGGFIASTIRDGSLAVSDIGANRGKQVGLAARLLERLPLFDIATIREILDIRRELDKHLVRFRASIIGFSDNVKNAQWDADFAAEAQGVFYRDVEPAVLALEEAIEDNSYLKGLIRKVTDKPPVSAGSVMGVAMSQLSDIPAAFAHMLGVAGAVGAGVTLLRAFDEWRQKQRVIEQNQLYFYYAAGQRLKALP